MQCRLRWVCTLLHARHRGCIAESTGRSAGSDGYVHCCMLDTVVALLRVLGAVQVQMGMYTAAC